MIITIVTIIFSVLGTLALVIGLIYLRKMLFRKNRKRRLPLRRFEIPAEEEEEEDKLEFTERTSKYAKKGKKKKKQFKSRHEMIFAELPDDSMVEGEEEDLDVLEALYKQLCCCLIGSSKNDKTNNDKNNNNNNNNNEDSKEESFMDLEKGEQINKNNSNPNSPNEKDQNTKKKKKKKKKKKNIWSN